MELIKTVKNMFSKTNIEQNNETAISVMDTKTYELTLKQKIVFLSMFASGLLFVLMFALFVPYNLGTIYFVWGFSMFETLNRSFYVVLPFVSFTLIFILRKKLRSINISTQANIMVSLGMIVFFWELLFDLTSIAWGFESNEGVFFHSWEWTTIFKQFIDGFLLCRLNMYILSIALMSRKVDLIKWIAATSLFGGFAVLVNYNQEGIELFKIVTHSILLPSIPPFILAMSGANYKVRNLVQAIVFNLTIVMIMIGINLWINGGWTTSSDRYGFPSIAGELTKDNLAKNPIAGWAKWPGSMFVWIFSVMIIECMYFILHRTIVWKTYQKSWSFKKTFKKEVEADRLEWYGFKVWGENSFRERRYPQEDNN